MFRSFSSSGGDWIGGSQLKDLPEGVKEKVYPHKGSPQWMHASGKFDPEYLDVSPTPGPMGGI